MPAIAGQVSLSVGPHSQQGHVIAAAAAADDCAPRCGSSSDPSPSAAHSGQAPDTLELVRAELKAVQHKAAQHAALLADCVARAAALREESLWVQGQQAACEAEIAAAQQAAAAAEREAAQQVPHGTAWATEQADALQREILHITCATATEQRRLEQAADAARCRAHNLAAIAEDRLLAAAGWQRRVRLMMSNHRPLTPAEAQRRAEDERRYWAGC